MIWKSRFCPRQQFANQTLKCERVGNSNVSQNGWFCWSSKYWTLSWWYCSSLWYVGLQLKTSDPPFTLKIQEFSTYPNLNFFSLKKTKRCNSDTKSLYKHTLKGVESNYRDLAGFGRNYDEFRNLDFCREKKKDEEYVYFQFDVSENESGGKCRFCNESRLERFIVYTKNYSFSIMYRFKKSVRGNKN